MSQARSQAGSQVMVPESALPRPIRARPAWTIGTVARRWPTDGAGSTTRDRRVAKAHWRRGFATPTLLGVSLAFGPASAAPPTGSPERPLAPTPVVAGAELPVGAIIAFVPRFGGGDYEDAAGLRRWLGERGWAICDGSNGTPDLRDRMLLGTDRPERTGEALGSWTHDHRVAGETDAPVRRSRATPTGREQLVQLPDDQHRHRIDLSTNRTEHLPPSLRVLFIVRLR